MTGDPFEGTWRAIQSEAARWHVAGQARPEQTCLRFEATDTGYLMVAYGVVDGKAAAERPQSIIADGRRRPLLDLGGRPIPGVPAGAMSFGSRPDPQTLELGAEVDGTVLSAGTYKVSADGQTLTVTNKGVGLKGPFEVVVVLERVVPDPYAHVSDRANGQKRDDRIQVSERDQLAVRSASTSGDLTPLPASACCKPSSDQPLCG